MSEAEVVSLVLLAVSVPVLVGIATWTLYHFLQHSDQRLVWRSLRDGDVDDITGKLNDIADVSTEADRNLRRDDDQLLRDYAHKRTLNAKHLLQSSKHELDAALAIAQQVQRLQALTLPLSSAAATLAGHTAEAYYDLWQRSLTAYCHLVADYHWLAAGFGLPQHPEDAADLPAVALVATDADLLAAALSDIQVLREARAHLEDRAVTLYDRLRKHLLPRLDQLLYQADDADRRRLTEVLARVGIVVLLPRRGGRIHPRLYDAVATDQPAADCGPGRCLRLVRPGYLWRHRVVLAKAQVIGAAPASSGEES
ncbi:MAG: hypothetical protein KKI08_16270 [Armatimonadetes bacterium]|nr:hypothetical protein [Armatimonadota bacterium]